MTAATKEIKKCRAGFVHLAEEDRRSAQLSTAHNRKSDEANITRSILQEFARIVERAERNAGLGKGIRGAFVAVHHGENQRDFAAGLAHGFDGFQRGAAGCGDVLDDDHALALQALALGKTFDREASAMLLWLLADEERRDRVALDP